MVPWDASLHSSPGQTELSVSALYQVGEAKEEKNWETLNIKLAQKYHERRKAEVKP